MTNEEKERIKALFEEYPDDCTCAICYLHICPSDCVGCPVYDPGAEDV